MNTENKTAKFFEKTFSIKGRTLLILLLILCACFGIRFFWSHYINVTSCKQIHDLVLSHEEELLASALEKLETGGISDNLQLPGLQDIYYRSDSDHPPIIQYETGCWGFASQTSYYGFYYSSTNQPRGFNGENLNLPDSVTGARCELDGDNWYYTEKITDNWYYYEMHF